VTGILLDCVHEVDLLASFRKILLVCINQDDTRERSSQVELMGRIWRQAQRAIVWLGEELDSAGAINWLHILALTKTWRDGVRLRYVNDAKFNAQVASRAKSATKAVVDKGVDIAGIRYCPRAGILLW
jgi:hypothetical protein